MAADDLLIGELRGRVMALEEQNKQVLVAMRQMSEDLREINETLASARGGWRTMMVIGGAGATLGGLLMGIITMVRGT